nr:MAG TPA: hypothetical protein [Crassvirales sp.]
MNGILPQLDWRIVEGISTFLIPTIVQYCL